MTPRTTPLRRGLVSARTRRKNPASDAPCRDAPGAETPEAPPEPLPPAPRQKDRPLRLEAPSIDGCPLTERFRARLERGPATVPRTWPFESGFRRSFALRSWEEGLDSAASASSRPRAHGAARRPSTSATETIHKHDLGPTEPLASYETYGFRRTSRGPREGSRALCRAAKPSGHGSGACARRLSPPRPAPLAALARAEGFAPTRLARTPLVVRPGFRGTGEVPRTSESTQRIPIPRAENRPRDALSLRPEQGRLTHVSAKIRALRRTRGAFRPPNLP